MSRSTRRRAVMVSAVVGLGLLLAAGAASGAPAGAPISVLADTTPPTVYELQPAPGVVDASTSGNIIVRFSESMDRAATEAGFTVVRESNAAPVAGTFQWVDADSVLRFHPEHLEPGTSYRVRLAGGRDLAGNALASQSWTFRTVGFANLVGNRSFETDTTGWGSYQGQLSRVASADAPHGGFVARATRTSGTFYSVGDSESGFRPTVASTVAGATYIATGYARAASASAVGKPVKITLRERNAANVTVREISTTATLGTDFTRLAVSADAAGSGNTLGMRLEQSKAVAGDAFDADWMSLVRAGSVMGGPGAGPGWTAMSADTKRVSGFARLVPNADVAKLRVYVDGKAAKTGSQAVRGLIYADTGGDPGNLLRRTDQVTIAAGRSAGWVDLKLSPPLQRLDCCVYYLGIQSGPNVVARFANNPAWGGLYFNRDALADGATDPFGLANKDDKFLSIYAIGG